MNDVKEVVNRALLKHAVANTITCPHTERVLDVKTTVVVTVTYPPGGKSEHVMIADHWETIKDEMHKAAELRSWTIEVLDGREVFK